MKSIMAMTILIFSLAIGLGGCDQAKEMATGAAEKLKQDAAAEIGKAVREIGQKTDSNAKKDDEKDGERNPLEKDK